MRDKILIKLKKDVAEKSMSRMAREIDIPYTTLYRIVKGEGTCTMKTWEKLETYYSPR